MSKQNITYKEVGVNYTSMDPFKIMAQESAKETADNIIRLGISEVFETRGESAYLVEFPQFFLAHVEEGLGTKNLVADAMWKLVKKDYYQNIAQDTVAMIVNDLITLGALPVSVAMHLAVAESEWFKHKQRSKNLIDGWKKACNLARCVWGGGETPTLKGILVSNTVLLSGSATGIINPKSRILSGNNICHGDVIILFDSSGVHANGLTLCRKIADNLPDGYLTKLPDGTMYGHTLLNPTTIYVSLIEELFKADVDIHYAVNITGHGWRKLMRANRNFSYIIEQLPTQQLIFDFIQEYGPVSKKEMYGNYNMGAGFAIYIKREEVNKVMKVAQEVGIGATFAGYILNSNSKQVVIQPKNIIFNNKDLKLR